MTDVSGSRTRFWSNISGRVNTVLPGTKMICALVIAFALVSVFATDGTKQFSINLDGIFSLVPRIWILFSAGFYERSIALSAADFVFIVAVGKSFEAAWGTREFVRFILVVVFSSTVSVVAIIFVLSLGLPSLKSGTNICGMAPLYMAFLAATKQLMSDLEVPVASLFYVRSSHLVTIGLLLVFVLSLFLGPCTFLFGFFGLVSGWIYLRFFQRKACGIVGDASSVFAFHTFFPEVLQGPIKACEDFVCKLKAAPMFRRFHSASDSTKGANEFDGHITIKVNPVDAERRKQIALNAVNEKLSEDTTV